MKAIQKHRTLLALIVGVVLVTACGREETGRTEGFPTLSSSQLAEYDELAERHQLPIPAEFASLDSGGTGRGFKPFHPALHRKVTAMYVFAVRSGNPAVQHAFNRYLGGLICRRNRTC